MDVRISPRALCGSVRAIESKSHAHRLLICAALAGGKTLIKCPESSVDIDMTAACLRALGADISSSDGGFAVDPIGLSLRDTAVLDCGESGSTLRFLLPVCCALGVNAQLQMSGRLPSRPMQALTDGLISHGCEISLEAGGVMRSSGKLQSGIYELPGNISSQFISGLLFALPLLDGDSEIRLTGKTESAPYIEMTLDALRLFGIKIDCGENRYEIKGKQMYRSPRDVTVEGDWSNAAFWLCAGAVGGGSVTCTGLNTASKQGDMAIVSLLERFGVNVERTENSVTVSGGRREQAPALRGIEIDASATPDLVPILAVLASVAEGKTVIYNAERLRIKESDRLKSVTATLGALGADIVETEDGLVIHGRERLRGGAVSSFGDHRIAMAAAVASCACEGETLISGAEAVNKSYPAFFRDFTDLGGVIENIK